MRKSIWVIIAGTGSSLPNHSSSLPHARSSASTSLSFLSFLSTRSNIVLTVLTHTAFPTLYSSRTPYLSIYTFISVLSPKNNVKSTVHNLVNVYPSHIRCISPFQITHSIYGRANPPASVLTHHPYQSTLLTQQRTCTALQMP